MLSHRTSIHRMYLFYYSLILSHSYVLVYHTENTPSTQYYDCIYSTQSERPNVIPGVKYCRQFDGHQPLQRDFNSSCHNGGQLWHFEKLALLQVPVEDVLQWSSSVEQTNHYAKYLSNRSLVTQDQYLCNCTNPSSFGKFCEYEFYGDTTSLDDAWIKQIEPRRNFSLIDDNIYVGSQLHNNRPCYITWTCFSGSMCLDWRSICDGKQQCTEGLDEDHCEMLEYNECEDDEYRCSNGMCIPEEYWLDSDYDCMDWSDEMNTTIRSGDSCFDFPSPVCDEHICTYNQWSCGDGQCVNDQTDRHEGTRYNVMSSFCKNMRDVNYMCDAVTRHSKSWWTIDVGYCLPYALDYQRLTLDSLSANDRCAFAVKCALSNSLDQSCVCKNATSCAYLVPSLCPPYTIYYPKSSPVLSSHFYMCYAPNRDWTKKKPDGLLLYGRVKCVGYQFITTVLYIWGTI